MLELLPSTKQDGCSIERLQFNAQNGQYHLVQTHQTNVSVLETFRDVMRGKGNVHGYYLYRLKDSDGKLIAEYNSVNSSLYDIISNYHDQDLRIKTERV